MGEVGFVPVSALFEYHDFQPGGGQHSRGWTAACAGPDYDNVD